MFEGLGESVSIGNHNGHTCFATLGYEGHKGEIVTTPDE